MTINAEIIKEQPDNVILYKFRCQHPEIDNRATKRGQHFHNNKSLGRASIQIGPTNKLCSNKYNRINDFYFAPAVEQNSAAKQNATYR